MNSDDRRAQLYLLLIFAAGLLLRLPNLGYSFYGDEQFSLLRDSKELITTTEDRFRPVFFSLLYLWRTAGFTGEIGLRLLPLLFGLLQIPVAYCVGRRIGGRTLATTFSLLVALSPMLIEFSQELRMYSLVALLGLVQALLLLRLLEGPRWRDWALFVLVAVAGVYTHLHYWLLLAGAGLAFFRERRSLPLWKGWGALALVVLLYLPNIPNLLIFQERRAGEYVVDLPSALPKLAAAVTVGFNYFTLPDQAAGRPLSANDLVRNVTLLALAAVPALLVLWGLIRRHRQLPRDRGLWLGHELFTVPILLAFAASVVTRQYWLQPKYVIFSTPFALLLIALGYESLRGMLPRVISAAGGALVLVIALLHFWNPHDYGRREDWRTAAQLLRSRMSPGSALVVIPGEYNLLSYYWPAARQRWLTIYVPSINSPSPEYVYGIQQRLGQASDVYYLWYDIRQNIADPRNVLLRTLDVIGTRTGVFEFNPRFKLYHWQLDHQSHQVTMAPVDPKPHPQ